MIGITSVAQPFPVSVHIRNFLTGVFQDFRRVARSVGAKDGAVDRRAVIEDLLSPPHCLVHLDVVRVAVPAKLLEGDDGFRLFLPNDPGDRLAERIGVGIVERVGVIVLGSACHPGIAVPEKDRRLDAEFFASLAQLVGSHLGNFRGVAV